MKKYHPDAIKVYVEPIYNPTCVLKPIYMVPFVDPNI